MNFKNVGSFLFTIKPLFCGDHCIQEQAIVLRVCKFIIEQHTGFPLVWVFKTCFIQMDLKKNSFKAFINNTVS